MTEPITIAKPQKWWRWMLVWKTQRWLVHIYFSLTCWTIGINWSRVPLKGKPCLWIQGGIPLLQINLTQRPEVYDDDD